jgi:hypothetical protein
MKESVGGAYGYNRIQPCGYECGNYAGYDTNSQADTDREGDDVQGYGYFKMENG